MRDRFPSRPFVLEVFAARPPGGAAERSARRPGARSLREFAPGNSRWSAGPTIAALKEHSGMSDLIGAAETPYVDEQASRDR